MEGMSDELDKVEHASQGRVRDHHPNFCKDRFAGVASAFDFFFRPVLLTAMTIKTILDHHYYSPMTPDFSHSLSST